MCPREYEAIRDSLKKAGKSDKAAKSEAAATYNKRHPTTPLRRDDAPARRKPSK